VAQALEDPMSILGPPQGLVVIDEAQRQPGIFPVLRVLADRKERTARCLILGSLIYLRRRTPQGHSLNTERVRPVQRRKAQEAALDRLQKYRFTID